MLIIYFILFSIFSFLNGQEKGFTWDEQRWESEQEKIFWLAIPDWGELKDDFYQYRYNQRGKPINERKKSGFSGFAKAHIHKEGIGYFRAVLEVEKGWIVTKKVWDTLGQKRILRKYERGVLGGRYIDWYENGKIKTDGIAENGLKDGLWIVWHPNGEKQEEGEWREGKAHGIFEEWYPDGRKANEQVFKRGLLVTALVWKPNGSLCKESRVENGEGLLLKYNQQGDLIGESRISSGKRVLPKGE